MALRPLQDRLLVKRLEEKEQVQEGLLSLTRRRNRSRPQCWLSALGG